MKVSLVSLLTTLAAVSVAQAIPARAPEALVGKPRYYFPRVIKRQTLPILNITLGDPVSGDSSSASSAPTADSSQDGKLSSDGDNSFNQPTQTPDSNTNDPTFTQSSPSVVTTDDSTTANPLLSSLLSAVTSDVLPSDSNTPGTVSATPTASNFPTASDSDAATPTADQNTVPTQNTAPTADPSSSGSVILGLSTIVSDLTNSILPTPSATVDPTPTNVASQSAAPTESNFATPTQSAGPTAPTSQGIVNSFLSSVASDVLPTSQSPVSQPPTGTGNTVPTQPPTSSVPIPLTSLLPGTSPTQVTVPTSVPTSLPTDISTGPPTQPTTGPTQIPTSIPTQTPTDIPTSTSGITGPGTGQSTTPVQPPPTTSATPISDPPTTTPTPPPTTTPSPVTTPTPPTTSQVPPTSGTGDLTTTPVVTPTSPPTTPPTSPASITPPSTSEARSSAPASSSPSSSPPVSVKPTGTNSETELPSQTSISTATNNPTDTPQSSASAIPSSLPRIIQPQGGVPIAPENSTLIQLGFTYGLNYPFVVSSSTAVAQIFSYLPIGVSYGIDLSVDKCVMQYLQAYNTLPTLGYITTLAMAYIPKDEVNSLSLALLNPNSALYNNRDPAVKTLMAMIDPSIPLLAGSSVVGGSPITSSNGAATSDDGNANGAAGDDANTSNSGVRPSSVGIGVGVVAGAAAYGAAMFFVARRYKKKKAAHRRTSSVMSGSTGSSMSHAGEGTDLMAGARGSYGTRTGTGQTQPQQPGRDSRNSDRSRETGRNYISPPVMAENSLGWN